MAEPAAKTLSHYLQHLVGVMRADPRTDAELLGRYIDTHDEMAFAVLVGRYAPLVWENCRRVLGATPDAEDAFQATFLALARKAASVRGDTLARWLYRVSQRVALDCRRSLLRRLRREARVASAARNMTASDASDDEKVIWEEVANLPDRLRVPVVLYYLDGKTQAEAGQVLGVSDRAVAQRLEQALTALRGRLVNRGFAITVAALGALLGRASTSSAAPDSSAAVSSLSEEFLRQVATATAQGRVSPSVMDLAARAVAPRVSLWLVGALVFVALGGVCSAALLFTETKNPKNPQAEPEVVRVAELQPKPDPAASDRGQPAPWATFAGKVTDKAGQPVAQANLAVLGRSWDQRGSGLRDVVLAKGTTDANGQFRLTVEESVPGEVNHVWLVVSTPTARTVALVQVAGGVIRNNIEVCLTPGQITGQVFDPKGQALAGATVRVVRFGGAAYEPTHTEQELLPAEVWPAPVTTGPDGRFTLSGLDESVDLKLSVAHAESGMASLVDLPVRRVTRPGVGERVARQGLEVRMLSARRFTGRVIAADTKMPFASVQVVVNFQPVAGAAPLTRVVRTDADGKFSMGVPVSPRWAMEVTSVPLPYLGIRREVPLPAGDGEVVLEIPLSRGVVASGRVIDSKTKAPIQLAKVRFFPRPSSVDLNARVEPVLPTSSTKPDGSFALAVPPVGGVIAITAPDMDYALAEVDPAETHGRPYAAHAVVSLGEGELPEAAVVQIERGRTIQGRVVYADGAPVPSGSVLCSRFIGGRDLQTPYVLAIEDGRFAIPGCRPDRTYTVLLVDRTLRYGATAKLAWSEKPTTVKLQSTGTATIEVRNNADQPQAAAVLSVELGLPLDSGAGEESPEIRWNAIASGGPVGQDGQRQLPGLIPGARYRIGVDRGRGMGRTETILTVPPGGHRQTTLVLPTPAPK